MRIKEIRLTKFKRFTDLTIKDIPRTAKLVVVVGPNGCGKSSLFDAMIQWHRGAAGFGYDGQEDYYKKQGQDGYSHSEAAKIELHGRQDPYRGCVYVRSAYRNEPEFNATDIARPEKPSEQIRIARTNANDAAVMENYKRLIFETAAGVYEPANDLKTVAELREDLIGKVRASMKRVFVDLNLRSIADPFTVGTFVFEKGTTKSYAYKNLSGGEKAVFDLLLDFHLKERFYSNAIFCVDEVETHLHTRAQGPLLKELIEIVPNDSQLWITTHSLGVIRAAQDMAKSADGSVCIIDFDGVEPDVPSVVVPSSVDRVSWEKLLSIALDDLSPRVAPRVVVVCEGSSQGRQRRNFDAEVYDRVLASQTTGVVFISGGSSNQVGTSGVSIRAAMTSIVPTAKIIGLVDLDDMSPSEVAEFEKGGDLILAKRNLESYLLADEVIEALLENKGMTDLLAQALQVKKDALASSVGRKNRADDLKSASGEIFVGLRELLGLTQAGNNKDSFMKDTLAPLITPSMQVYKDLKAAIIVRLPE